MKNTIEAIAIIFAFVGFSACNEEDDAELGKNDPTPIELDAKSQTLLEADNSFGFDVMKQLNKTEEENFTISPLSISLALAMTYNGAEGETKTAMEEALRISGLTTDEINQSYQSLIDALLNADDKVTLEVAQSIWYRMGFNVLDSFKTVNQTYYDAEVNELDFSQSDAKDIINDWIEDKTHDKIQDMIEEVSPDDVMFLINAIYFNGEWQRKFDKSNTTKCNFTTGDNQTVQVDMMQKEDSVQYMSNNLFSAIEMPYGRGNFDMIVMLPDDGVTCNDIIDELTSENWETWKNSFYAMSDIEIWMPKFKDEYNVKLNDALSAMGMEIAFTSNADFSGINSNGGIYIDYVQHKTFIDVSEKGTEAAAATVVAIAYTSALPSTPTFHVTKPFIYAITEKETGAILFMGKITKPEYN